MKYLGKKIIALVVFVTLLFCSEGFGAEQGEQEDQAQVVDKVAIMDKLTAFYLELQELTAKLSFVEGVDSLSMIDKQRKHVEFRWDKYYAENNEVISENDVLISEIIEWQVLMERLVDTMSYKRGLSDARVEFARVEVQFGEQDALYDDRLKQAQSFALVKSLADKLEQLKSDEQVIMERVNNDYQSLKQLGEQYLELRERVDALEGVYVKIRQRSELIQQQEFKPWLVRMKDYLLSIAAVAMILMFLNMAHAKYKQIKAESKRLKEMKKMMGGDKQYPTI